MAANHPTEDRLKVSQVKGSQHLPDTLFFGVFDGHGGSFFSDVISKRLFNYIALALSSDPVKFIDEVLAQSDGTKSGQLKDEKLINEKKPINEGKLINEENLINEKLINEENLINQELINENLMNENRSISGEEEEDELTSYAKLFRVVDNLVVLPKTDQHKNIYDSKSLTKIRKLINMNEKNHLKRYGKELMDSRVIDLSIEERIIHAFTQCDDDIAKEIQESLRMIDDIPLAGMASGHKLPGHGLDGADPNVVPGLNYRTREDRNLLKHFYLSLAVSGSCANVLIVQGDTLYTANCGDCRTVLGFLSPTGQTSAPGQASAPGQVKFLELSTDHNADNVSEVKRVYSSHPSIEQNNIIRHDRLLGQLMPLRAFGDFGYKWPVQVIRSTGLLKAFGPHVIPPFYETPPYLTAEPEVLTFDLSELSDGQSASVVIATDGLWEQYSSREALETVTRFQNDRQETSDEFEYDFINQHKEVSDVSKVTSNDTSTATHLLRTVLSEAPFSVNHETIDEEELARYKHRRLVSFLTLPESVVRNFRDDISIIILSICAK